MANEVRPISRVLAVELNDSEVDSVSGAAAAAGTDTYTKQSNGSWKFDSAKPSDE